MTSATEKHLLLIGASRGLGLAIAEQYLQRGWAVTATERSSSPARRELSEKSDGRLAIETVDITSTNQVTALRERLAAGTFDMLFVNAGVANGVDETTAQISTLEFERVLVTNTLSPMRVFETFHDLVPASGTLGVMSSGQGSVSNNVNGGFVVYRASKAALNSLMGSFRARLSDDPRTMLLMAPGWVRTDLGGSKARLSIDESIPRLVATIEAQAGKGSLQFLDYTGAVVPW
jgi:NAD(P)-dependent dehydrogenase (short-subunit alcohol dehydrogenase family)